jgi:two-component system response regulator YesN
MRPIDYLNRRRIERAQSLLCAGQKSIKEVARATGFADPAYFSRIFSRYVGITPATYARGSGHDGGFRKG